MKVPIVIKMAVTKSGIDSESNDFNNFLNYLNTELKDTDVYKIEPEFSQDSEIFGEDIFHSIPIITGAAYDIILIVQTVGSIASIASFLWIAYEKFVKSNSRFGGIFISIGKGKTKTNIHIGEEYKDKDIFIKTFTKKISEIKDSSEAQEDYNETIAEIKSSRHWKKK